MTTELVAVAVAVAAGESLKYKLEVKSWKKELGIIANHQRKQLLNSIFFLLLNKRIATE